MRVCYNSSWESKASRREEMSEPTEDLPSHTLFKFRYLVHVLHPESLHLFQEAVKHGGPYLRRLTKERKKERKKERQTERKEWGGGRYQQRIRFAESSLCAYV